MSSNGINEIKKFLANYGTKWIKDADTNKDSAVTMNFHILYKQIIMAKFQLLKLMLFLIPLILIKEMVVQEAQMLVIMVLWTKMKPKLCKNILKCLIK